MMDLTTISQLSKRTGRNRITLQVWAKRLGLTRLGNQYVLTPEECDKLLATAGYEPGKRNPNRA